MSGSKAILLKREVIACDQMASLAFANRRKAMMKAHREEMKRQKRQRMVRKNPSKHKSRMQNPPQSIPTLCYTPPAPQQMICTLL